MLIESYYTTIFTVAIRIKAGCSVVKNLLASAETSGDVALIPGSGRSLEKEMATHSNLLASIIQGTEEPGRLQSMGLQRVRHD